ncbi:uncharacterized [Tachysurus ichikawai]
MVVGGERVPDAVLVVVVLAMGDVLCVAHCHLLTTVPEKNKENFKSEEQTWRIEDTQTSENSGDEAEAEERNC